MKRFSVNNKMIRRSIAVICTLALMLVFALPCFAEEADLLIMPAPETSAADQAVESIEVVSDTSVSNSDVSDTDVSSSDEGGSLNDTFKIMGQGMLGIFVVMMLIYLVIVILNATTGKKKDDAQL
ncbi:MAG: hypothetical protein E7559_09890 [Ruminococcaceae bacterium]|nr:hypothetical protein [Oscillospiraceae bacterium]